MKINGKHYPYSYLRFFCGTCPVKKRKGLMEWGLSNNSMNPFPDEEETHYWCRQSNGTETRAFWFPYPSDESELAKLEVGKHYTQLEIFEKLGYDVSKLTEEVKKTLQKKFQLIAFKPKEGYSAQWKKWNLERRGIKV